MTVVTRKLSIAGALALCCAGAMAQSYPVKPIRMIAPMPAASGADIVARMLGEKMTDILGKTVVVDNRSGASGIIGAELAAKSVPDGYTLILCNVATHAININVVKNLSYHPVKDFAPITLVGVIPNVLLVNAALPANSIKELIALARAKPGQLTFGSAGNWTGPHLGAELFKMRAGIDITHVPYKGSTPALLDLLGGRIDMYFSGVLTAVPHMRSGKLKALGVTSATRSSVAPEVPTIAESGLPGFEDYNWYGVLGPAGMPRTVVTKLNQTIVQVLKMPDIRDRLMRDGLTITASSPEEFTRFMVKEIDKYAKIVKDSGLRIE